MPFCLGVLLPALALLGCGQEEKLTPLRGQVFYQGKPLPGGTIVFSPDVERGGRGPLACGEIAADGRYTLRTQGAPGVVPGWHRVTIAPPSEALPGSPATAAPPATVGLPRKYSDPEQSGLLCEIKAGGSGQQDFHLE